MNEGVAGTVVSGRCRVSSASRRAPARFPVRSSTRRERLAGIVSQGVAVEEVRRVLPVVQIR
jgi:hypothetical protein